MRREHYVVMGAGEVGYHLAQTLSQKGEDVTVIELDPARQARIDEELDVRVVGGNGAHPPVLAAAGVDGCELFMAVSSSDEANLAAANLAKDLGAQRAVVRVAVAEEVITYRRLLEQTFNVDLLLSTQLLTTTRVLNEIHGHSTMAVEYLAAGRVQLRKIHLDADSPLVNQPLRDVLLPRNSLAAAFYRGDELIIPGGDDQAREGDDVLILGTSDVIEQAELTVSNHRKVIGKVVIAGGGETGSAVARALAPLKIPVKIIEIEKSVAKRLAAEFPAFEIIHGDATDLALLKAERIGLAKSFVGLTANDESNLMACLLAQELGVEQVLAMVHRSETTQLWRRLGMQEVFSPRTLARERIEEYIESGYSANIVSLHKGTAQVLERKLAEASPASGVTLAEMSPPRGLIVGAVMRGEEVFVPRGNDRLEAGDLVILFVHESELDTVRLLFPGRQRS